MKKLVGGWESNPQTESWVAVPQNLTLRAESGSGHGTLLLSPVHSVNPTTTRHRQITIQFRFRWTPLITIFFHIHIISSVSSLTRFMPQDSRHCRRDGTLFLLQLASIFSSAVFSFSGRFVFQSAWNSIYGGEHMGRSRMRFGHVKSRLFKCKPVCCPADAARAILS